MAAIEKFTGAPVSGKACLLSEPGQAGRNGDSTRLSKGAESAVNEGQMSPSPRANAAGPCVRRASLRLQSSNWLKPLSASSTSGSLSNSASRSMPSHSGLSSS